MIIDISRPLANDMPLYPGNPPFELKIVRKYEKLNAEGREGSQLSVFTTGSHNGTHVDGPVHCGLANGVEQWPLDCFYGPCRVVSVEGEKEITANHVKNNNVKKGERILFKTDNSKFDEFRLDFTYLSLGAAQALANIGVALVGTDGLAIQKKGSTTQDVHRTLLAKIPIIEGLQLKHVELGNYLLCAFPLAMGGDGALTRAVLIK